jgi:protein-S-isoprenylcysteine O-methyltransferase Ste14
MMRFYTAAAYAAWIVILVAWLVLQRHRKATAHRPKGASQRLATVLVVVGLFLLLSPVTPGFIGFTITPHTPGMGLPGAFLAISGALFAVSARMTLGSNWAGGGAASKHQHELIQRGPYGLVRHPIYTGFTAAALGTAMTSGTLAAYLAVISITAGILVRIRWEEQLLTMHFACEYAAYKTRCKALIPFLW